MTTNLQKFQAEVFRVGLICGCVSKDEIISWADSIILESESADYVFFELSLSANKAFHEIALLLLEISQKHDHFNACRRVLGRMAYICEIRPQLINIFARGLYELVIENSYDLPSDLNFLLGIDDEYALAAEGIIGTLDEVDKSLIKELDNFKSEDSASSDWYLATLDADE
ncbi:MAG: hypothetical protein MUC94_04815 [bacterium]|jgi:hypothetical protein|nr:hypothetical protein [bacterium]